MNLYFLRQKKRPWAAEATQGRHEPLTSAALGASEMLVLHRSGGAKGWRVVQRFFSYQVLVGLLRSVSSSTRAEPLSHSFSKLVFDDGLSSTASLS